MRRGGENKNATQCARTIIMVCKASVWLVNWGGPMNAASRTLLASATTITDLNAVDSAAIKCILSAFERDVFFEAHLGACWSGEPSGDESQGGRTNAAVKALSEARCAGGFWGSPFTGLVRVTLLLFFCFPLSLRSFTERASILEVRARSERDSKASTRWGNARRNSVSETEKR